MRPMRTPEWSFCHKRGMHVCARGDGRNWPTVRKALTVAAGAQERGTGRKPVLLYFPGVAGLEELVEVAGAALGDYVLKLLGHYVFVAGEVVPGAEDADGSRESGPVLHVREQEGVGGPGVVRVVYDEIGFADA